MILPQIEPQDAAQIGAAVIALSALARAIRRAWSRRKRARWARRMQRLDDLAAMTPNQFEAYTAAAFEAKGWRVEIVGKEGRPDGGLDLLLTAKGRRVVVQCKRYRAKVGAATVRETVGVMIHHKAQGAYVVALSGFTRQAQTWAQGKPLKLIDGSHLLRVLASPAREI